MDSLICLWVSITNSLIELIIKNFVLNLILLALLIEYISHILFILNYLSLNLSSLFYIKFYKYK